MYGEPVKNEIKQPPWFEYTVTQTCKYKVFRSTSFSSLLRTKMATSDPFSEL